MPLKDPESQGYGSIPDTDQQTIEEAEAAEGPFPVDMKRMLIAELFGTAIYVQLGIGALSVSLYTSTTTTTTGMWQEAIVWAIALTVGIYVSAAVSGGHLNPAVSLSFALVRPADFSFRKLIPYWVAQLLGAMLAGAMNLFVFHRAISRFEKKNHVVFGGIASAAAAVANATKTSSKGTITSSTSTTTTSNSAILSASAFGDYWSLHDKLVTNAVHAFFIEAVGTAILVFVIFVTTHRKNPIPGATVPPIIGATLGALVAVLGPLTNGAFNPARDMGPRLVTVCAHWGVAAMQDYLPYLIGPLLGGPIGAFFADKILYLS